MEVYERAQGWGVEKLAGEETLGVGCFLGAGVKKSQQWRRERGNEKVKSWKPADFLGGKGCVFKAAAISLCNRVF